MPFSSSSNFALYGSNRGLFKSRKNSLALYLPFNTASFAACIVAERRLSRLDGVLIIVSFGMKVSSALTVAVAVSAALNSGWNIADQESKDSGIIFIGTVSENCECRILSQTLSRNIAASFIINA